MGNHPDNIKKVEEKQNIPDIIPISYSKAQVGSKWLDLIYKKESQQLKTIKLRQNKITPIGMWEFAKMPWNNLEILFLYNNSIGNYGCKCLSKMRLRSIKEVTLQKNQIGSQGVSHLAKAQWTTLLDICLGPNFITDDGIKSLVRANWRNLRVVDAQQNRFTNESKNKLVSINIYLSSITLHKWQVSAFDIKIIKKMYKHFRDKFGYIEIEL